VAVHSHSFLIGFRNRLLVMIQWAWSYLTYERSACLITGSDDLPGWIQSQLTPQSEETPKKTKPCPLSPKFMEQRAVEPVPGQRRA
jgi:hypothetical protein